jgi:hypothetical protein
VPPIAARLSRSSIRKGKGCTAADLSAIEAPHHKGDKGALKTADQPLFGLWSDVSVVTESICWRPALKPRESANACWILTCFWSFSSSGRRGRRKERNNERAYGLCFVLRRRPSRLTILTLPGFFVKEKGEPATVPAR